MTNMKRLILIVGMMLAANAPAMAQITELMHFSGAVTVGETDKMELQRRVRTWLREGMPEEYLEKNTAKENAISGTSFLRYDSKVPAASNMTHGSVMYDFEITVSDQGITYLFTNFRHEGKIKFHAITDANHFPHKIQAVEKPWYDLVWRDIKQQLNHRIPQMLETMQQAAKNEESTAKLDTKAKNEAARLTGTPPNR